MSIYQPLRDTFRELNRLLVDKQQFTAQQKLNQSNQELKNKMLEVTIADKEFTKDIAVAGLDIRRSGQRRLKSLADKQLLVLQQQLDKGELEAEKNQALLKPREYSLNSILGNDPKLLTNPGLKKEIESLFTDIDPNATWDPAGGGMIVKGERHKLSGYDMAQRIAPAVMAIKESYTDAPSDAVDRLVEIESEFKGIKDATAGLLSEESAQYAGNLGLANISSLKSSHFVGKRAELKQKENALKAERIKLEQFISPMGRMDYWNDKRDYFHRMANYFETLGEPGAADNIRIRAGQAATTANTWLTAGTKGQSAAGTLQMKPIWNKAGQVIGSKDYSTKTGWLTPLKEGELPAKPTIRKPDDAEAIAAKHVSWKITPQGGTIFKMPMQIQTRNQVLARTNKRIHDYLLANKNVAPQDARAIADQEYEIQRQTHNAVWADMQKIAKDKKRNKKERMNEVINDGYDILRYTVREPFDTQVHYVETPERKK